jgi:hypothetical protein
MTSPGEETGAGYGVQGVKETFMMAETDSEKSIFKVKAFFIYCEMREEERMT